MDKGYYDALLNNVIGDIFDGICLKNIFSICSLEKFYFVSIPLLVQNIQCFTINFSK